MARPQREQGFGMALRQPMLRGDLSAWFGWWPERISFADVVAGWKSALAGRGAAGSPATVQLYTHFALCQSSCRFCMYFHVVPRDDHQVSRYTDYLVALLGRYREALGRIEISNAYFGGGTPSALPAAELGRFLQAFGESFHVRNEFTCEGHPSNLDEAKLELLRRAGVNRLSMGLQSFDPAVLKRIGRTNPSLPRVAELVRCARAFGMWTNADLVVGLPGQTPDSFHDDLDRLLARGRPDCITVYRYQPVDHLPDVPGEEMRYSRVLTQPVILRALRMGYLPATTGGDDRPGKNFLRNSPRTWRQWVDRFRYEAVRLVRGDAELPVYALFENGDAHILGIGPGARSHIYGHSWYREVTAVADLSPATEPVYLGTRLTPEDECRSALLLGLAKSRWIDARALERRSGIDMQATFGPLLDRGVRTGALRRIGRWYRPARGASPATHPELFEALLPSIAPDMTARAQRAVEIAALRSRDDVQKELVALDAEHLRAVDAEQDEPLLAWARLVGLGSPGQTFAEATIERVGGGGEACFHVLPPPAPALRVIVEWDTGQRNFFRAGPYSISYATREHTSLAPAEEDFLQALHTRTTEALVPTSTSVAPSAPDGGITPCRS
jgi:oxygen-independent coproporphyrinogen-3 oxidase